MRIRRSFTRLFTASLLVGLVAAAAASAHRHFGYPGRCQINMQIAPRLITAGESTEISGRLACRRAGASGQTVEVYARSAGSAGFSPIGNATTESTGAYKFTTAPEDGNTDFYVLSDGARSATQHLRVAASVTLSGPAEGTQIETGVPETFTGTVNPVDVGAKVILQRQNAVSGNEWHWIGVGQVGAEGSFTIAHSFKVPGDASIRVLVRSDGVNIPSSSNILEYEISQAQNAKLTILASQDPLTYGQSVVISGVLAGVTSDQPVTLWAHTAHQRGFAPVTEIQTTSNGSYSFPAQLPVYSTYYEVKGGGQTSALLYVGVNALLTAEASPTTVESGQAVTFSGKVSPESAGHVIYLEAQNAKGTGFHVIQVGRVLPGSTYSILHQFYVPGTKTVRIDLPGGPGNGRALSETFTITVNPAPATALAPLSPENNSLPSEGALQGSEKESTFGASA